ncbi:MAG TPA: DUF2079 domain-containing protein [Caldilineae bacterium]|nr:DUF2079 domain-containing protein [Caldilineae bacterium]
MTTGRHWDRYRLLLAALIVIYVVVFAWLAFDLHAAMRTHKSDLGQMDQAVWNTSRGRFVESVQDDFVSTRMTDHVEPIFALIAPVFWLWDDVRAILLLQVLFVALGAWPLFELARRKTPPLVALALAAAYLLNPALQAAVLTEFHAIPLAVPLILWAFWAVEAQRWGQFVVAALLVASVKEEAALLAAGLGVWAMWRGRMGGRERGSVGEKQSTISPTSDLRPLISGLAVLLLSLLWFYLATFVIVPAHAEVVYGAAESSYFQRYGALGNSPLDIVKSFFTQPGVVWGIASEPARVRYLLGLLAAFGFLSLLAPEILLLSLPVLLANLLSAYPAQYYGEFHYTAPLVPYFAVAAAYGAHRLLRLASRLRPAVLRFAPYAIAIWLLLSAGFVYFRAGHGPLGGRYDPAPITAHHRLLERFVAQIPDEAAVTATAAVHPHVSHRRYVYSFPRGLEAPGRADWALIDVTTNTDMAPGDVRDTVEAMLAGDWGVVDAADGFLLLSKAAADKTIPDAFYDFARSQETQAVAAGPLTFLAADVRYWPRWRESKLVTRWLVGPDHEAGRTRPWVELRTPAGATVYTIADLTPPALIWYPPERWQPGDVLTIESLPLYLPRTFGALVGVAHGPDPGQPADRLPIAQVTSGDYPLSADGTLALVGIYEQQADGLQTLPLDVTTAPDFAALLGRDLRESGGRFRTPADDDIALTAWLPAGRARPGRELDLWLRWEDAVPEGYVPFVHIRKDGKTIAQSDGPPIVFFPTGGVDPASEAANDWRQIPLPADLAPGDTLLVVVGLYNPADGSRLEALDGAGQPAGNELTLGVISRSR